MRTEFEHCNHQYSIASQRYDSGLYVCVMKDEQIISQDAFNLDLYSKSFKKKHKINNYDDLERNIHQDFKECICSLEEV
jgi:NADPH-dependent 7-cyano-7-deazaguanine reductase QueF-like protein